MKRIALIFLTLACFNSKAMQTEAVSMEEVQPAVATGQRLLTRELLGDAYLAHEDNKIQARVFNQFKMNGGNASCGYQALHNGLILAKLIFSQDETEQKKLQKSLLEDEAKKELFESNKSTWRKHIARSRADDYTDWLESDEINDLCNKFVLPLLEGRFHFHIIGDLPWNKTLKDDPRLTNVRDNQTTSPFQKFLDDYQSNADLLGMFIMYDGEPSIASRAFHWLKNCFVSEDDVSLNQASNHGHWYCLVINRVDNILQVALAESKNNVSRLNDKRVDEFIELLDNKAHQEIHLSTSNNLFTLKNIVAVLIVAVLVGTIAKKKLTQKSSPSTRTDNSKDSAAQELQKI